MALDEVSMENGYVKVVSLIDETPAARAGLLPGDLITHLDGKAVLGPTLNQAVELVGQGRHLDHLVDPAGEYGGL